MMEIYLNRVLLITIRELITMRINTGQLEQMMKLDLIIIFLLLQMVYSLEGLKHMIMKRYQNHTNILEITLDLPLNKPS